MTKLYKITEDQVEILSSIQSRLKETAKDIEVRGYIALLGQTVIEVVSQELLPYANPQEAKAVSLEEVLQLTGNDIDSFPFQVGVEISDCLTTAVENLQQTLVGDRVEFEVICHDEDDEISDFILKLEISSEAEVNDVKRILKDFKTYGFPRTDQHTDS